MYPQTPRGAMPHEMSLKANALTLFDRYSILDAECVSIYPARV
jgi:hypothetical protein